MSDAALRQWRTIDIAMPYTNVRGRRRRELRLSLQAAFDTVPGLAIAQVWDQIAVEIL